MRKIALTAVPIAALAIGFANKAAAETPAAAPASTPERVAPVVTSALSITLPERKAAARGSVSLYPFDSLTATGMFFGVKNKDKRSMSSVISNQNKKHKVPVKDANGNVVFKMTPMKDANGNVTNVPTSDPETTYERKFDVVEVDAEIAAAIQGTEAEGSTVLVRRIV